MQSETFQSEPGQLVRDAPLRAAGTGVLSWRDEADRLVAVNFGSAPGRLPELAGEAELVASTDPGRLAGDVALERFVLLPREAVLLRLPAR